MAETIISQLDRAFALPLETNRQVNFIIDRDAIPALRRWQGMQVFIISEQKTYTLKTGILNTDWVESEAASLTGYTEQGGYTGTAQDIVDSIEMVTSGIEIISITHIANLDYYVVADPYKINSEYYSAAPTTVTLTVGDATNARIDVIYADVDGLIGVLAGTPSATPVKPIVSNTQRELTFRTVPALATVDPVVTNELVFDENVGVAGGEFDVDGWNLTALNFNSTTVAFSGTKSIYFDGVDPYFNVDFKNDANIAVSGLSSFYFRVYVTEVLDRNISFFFQCLDTSFIATGTYRAVKDGLFGFDRNVLNVWQLVSIPIAFFNLPVADIKGIRFMVSSIKKPKMYIDTMAFQYNVTQPDLTTTIYELTSNKQNSLATDGTGAKYTTVDAVNAGLSTKFDDSDALTPVTALNKIVTESDIASFGGGDMLLATAQSVTGKKTFDNTKLAVKGSSTGVTNLETANASATDYIATLPAKTGTVAMTDDIVTDFPDLTNKYDDYAWAMSDVATDLVAGDTSPVYATFPFTLNGFFVSVGTAPTGASIVVDLKKNGTTVLSTQAQIQVSEFTSLTGVDPVVSVLTFAKGDKITAEIVQVGSTIAGADLKIYLDITRI